MKFGAGGRIRTPDLLITNQLLYQLSYTSRSNSRVYLTRWQGFCQQDFHIFFVFFEEGAILPQNFRRRWRHPLFCTLCGREIPAGWEYWYCNGSCVCPDCLVDFARSELAPFRHTRGGEAFL